MTAVLRYYYLHSISCKPPYLELLLASRVEIVIHLTQFQKHYAIGKDETAILSAWKFD